MDISDTLAPNSEQLDAVDLLGGAQTFTITAATRGNAEQPVNLALAEFPRPWRPGKSMRRVLVACWGPDASKYVGRRVELFCDPDVRYGGQAVGGTRIKRLSHIDGTKRIPLLVSRGKSAIYTVEPLPNVAPTTLARMPDEEEARNAIEALMAQLGLDEETEKRVTSWATNGRTDDWTALNPDEAARLIDALEKKAAEQ